MINWIISNAFKKVIYWPERRGPSILRDVALLIAETLASDRIKLPCKLDLIRVENGGFVIWSDKIGPITHFIKYIPEFLTVTVLPKRVILAGIAGDDNWKSKALFG